MNLEPIPFVSAGARQAQAERRSGAGRRRAVDLQPLARRLRVAGAAPPHRPRVPPDVGRRRRGGRGRVGARSRAARRELPRDARRRAARVQPTASGSRCGRCARSSACRSSPTSAAAPTPGTRGSKSVAAPAVRVGVHVPARRLVADLRRRVRTAPRAEARDHRDAGQLVPAAPRPSSTRCTRSTTRSATSR